MANRGLPPARARLSLLAAICGLATLAAFVAPPSARAEGPHRSCSRADRSGTSRAKPGCTVRPTRLIDLAVNLDLDARSSWSEFSRGGYARLSSPSIVPAATIATSIRDPRGRLRRIEIHWALRGGLEWIVAVTPPVVPATPSIYGKLSVGFLVPSDAWAAVRFDARGELIGPETVEVVVPPEPSPGFGSGDPEETHPEQPLTLRLRSRIGETTLSASSFLVQSFETKTRRPSKPKRRTRSCFLDPDLRGGPLGGEGALPSVDASGLLVPNSRQHFAGHRIDPVSGLQEANVSDVQIPMRTMPPRATTKVVLELARAVEEPVFELEPGAYRAPFDRGSVVWISVFDPLGRAIPIALSVVRTGPDVWAWFVHEERTGRVMSSPVFVQVGGEAEVEASLINALAASGQDPTRLPTDLPTGPGIDFAPGDMPPFALEIPEELNGVFSNSSGGFGPEALLGRGRLRFGTDGILVAVEQEGVWLAPDGLPVLTRPAREYGESGQVIELDFGVGRSRVEREEAVLRIEQDGYGPGVLSSLRISRELVVEGIASNGAVVPLAALAFAEPGERVCDLACSNGRDDDRDGRIDFGDDEGCDSVFDGSEESSTSVRSPEP